MEQRKRRRKKCPSGTPMAVGSREWVNVERNSGDVMQLAHKYMQKCRVESSTDSESDANTEVVLTSSFPGGSLKKTAHKKLQFLDPYDGDYEEVSGTSDCSLDSLSEACPQREICPKNPIPEDLTVEENFSTKRQESLFAPPYRGVSPTVTHETDCMKPRDNLMFIEPAMEDDRKSLTSRLSQEAEPDETAERLQPTTEASWFMQHNPSVCRRFAENVAPASVLQPIVRLSDKRACEDPIVKRKPGQPVLECAGEKLRKKLRAT